MLGVGKDDINTINNNNNNNNNDNIISNTNVINNNTINNSMNNDNINYQPGSPTNNQDYDDNLKPELSPIRFSRSREPSFDSTIFNPKNIIKKDIDDNNIYLDDDNNKNKDININENSFSLPYNKVFDLEFNNEDLNNNDKEISLNNSYFNNSFDIQNDKKSEKGFFDYNNTSI